MKRSGGVTASAVIAIIGSVFAIFFGGFAILAALMMRIAPNFPTPQGQPAPPISVGTLLLVESILYLGFGVWGIVSAIGLLRLRNWARICFLIYAVWLCCVGVFGTLGILMAMLIMPQIMPPQSNVPPGVMAVVFAMVIVFVALQAALGIWWLVYFNRRGVKAQFMGEAAAALPRRRPLSITIIAWMLVLGAICLPIYLITPAPVFLFGFVIQGWIGRAILFLLTLIGMLAGIGMLRYRQSAHSLAVGYFGFNLLCVATNILMPGSYAHMMILVRQIAARDPNLPTTFLTERVFLFGTLIGILFSGAVLWFLITRRQAFLDACQAQPPAPAVGSGDMPGAPS